MLSAYGSNVAEEPPKIPDHAINVPPLIHKLMSFAVSDLPDDIKGQKLQPFRKVTDLVLCNEQGLGLIEKFGRGVVHRRLVLHKSTHGEGAVDASALLSMFFLVDEGEERGKTFAFGDSLLDDIKVGLLEVLGAPSGMPM